MEQTKNNLKCSIDEKLMLISQKIESMGMTEDVQNIKENLSDVKVLFKELYNLSIPKLKIEKICKYVEKLIHELVHILNEHFISPTLEDMTIIPEKKKQLKKFKFICERIQNNHSLAYDYDLLSKSILEIEYWLDQT